MATSPEILFVYGTLQDPERLAALLHGVSRWRVVGQGTVQGRLYDAGAYPALVASDAPADRVPGLVLELESGAAALARLDTYEGVGEELYERRRLSVLADGTTHEAWGYVYLRSIEGLRRIPRW